MAAALVACQGAHGTVEGRGGGWVAFVVGNGAH